MQPVQALWTMFATQLAMSATREFRNRIACATSAIPFVTFSTHLWPSYA